MRGLSQWDAYREQVEQLKEVVIIRYKERFACTRLVSLITLSRMRRQMKQCLAAQRVRNLYKRTCLFLALKLLLYSRRMRKRHGEPLERRLEVGVIHTRLSLFGITGYDAAVQRSKQTLHTVLSLALTQVLFDQKC